MGVQQLKSVLTLMAGGWNPPIFHSNQELNSKEGERAISSNKLFYLVTPPAQKVVRLWILRFQLNRFIDVFLRRIITNTHYVFVISKYNSYKSR